MSTRLTILLAVLGAACAEPASEPPPDPPAAAERLGPRAASDREPGGAEESPLDDEPPAPPAAGPEEHRFELIAYPPIEGVFGPRTRLEFQFFLLSLRIVAQGTERDPLEGMTVRMHLSDGSVIEPGRDPFPNMIGGHRQEPRTTWLRMAPFGWQRNALDEAWVSVDLGAHGRYWLEVPYGMVRDPGAPLPAADSRTRPSYALAMSELTARDHLVPFRHVRYDVGEIQNGWRLAVLASNPFDPHVELELYRDDGGVGQSVYRWPMDDPPTAATFVLHRGRRAQGMRMLTRLHEDGMRRSDHFTSFGRPSGRRGWGTLEVHVAGEVRSIRVPSSLYLYTHGTADPYDERRTEPAATVLGPWLF